MQWAQNIRSCLQQHMKTLLWFHIAQKQGKVRQTFPELSAGLQGGVDGDGGVEDACCLPEALLPGHMVGQLAQAVGHAAQVYAAITLPGPPRSCPIVAPGP